MNNRRQTIWLVSMLSLMVILSAYYLFTEDAPSANKPASQTQEAAGSKSNTDNGALVFPVDGTNTDAAGEDAGKTDQGAAASPNDGSAATGTDKNAAAGKSGDGSSITPSDEAVLEQYNNQTGTAYFDNLQMTREDNFSQQEEKLNGIIANTSKYTSDEAVQAKEQLNQLQDIEERISSLETKLHSDYDNAVVVDDDQKHIYQVVVQADKLDKGQALSIVETAMKELNVGPGQVSVKYIPNP